MIGCVLTYMSDYCAVDCDILTYRAYLLLSAATALLLSEPIQAMEDRPLEPTERARPEEMQQRTSQLV